MKRTALLLTLLSALSLGSAGPVAAAASDARIVGITPGFRQDLVEIESLTYDPGSSVAILTVTVHCFVGYYQIDADTVAGPFVSQIEFGIDAAAVQRSKPIDAPAIYSSPTAVSPTITITDGSPCLAAQDVGLTSPDQVVTFAFAGLKPGYTTFATTINTGIFSGHVRTTTLIRAILPAR